MSDQDPAAATLPQEPQEPQEPQDPPSPPSKTTIPPPPGLVVPGAPRPVSADITRGMIWIYGPTKIGKTTLIGNLPGVYWIATEKGQDWIQTREPLFISHWYQYLEWLKGMLTWRDQLKAAHAQDPSVDPTMRFGDGKPIRLVAIDTVDDLHRMCQEAVCEEMNVTDPGEIPHGGGWARVNKEWNRAMTLTRSLPMGMACISHERQKEFTTRAVKVHRMEPYIGAGGFRWCSAAADLIMHASMQEVTIFNEDGSVKGIEEQRVLRLHPSAAAIAGGRMAQKLPAVIPMDIKELLRYFPGTPTEE